VPLAAGSSSGNISILIFVLLIAGMYFLMIRPQQRRNRQVQQMQSRLGLGDEVMTGSGIYGTIVEFDEIAGTVTIEVAPEVDIKFAKGAIARVITPAPHEQGDGPTYPTAADDGISTARKVVDEG
jgi:preprotein translocase subunit YajC